jgi:hypothetical protein
MNSYLCCIDWKKQFALASLIERIEQLWRPLCVILKVKEEITTGEKGERRQWHTTAEQRRVGLMS